MIQNVETKNADSVKHRFKLAQAVNWLLNIFKGLGESTNNQALVSDGNGSLAFEEVITTEGGQSIAGNLAITGSLTGATNLLYMSQTITDNSFIQDRRIYIDRLDDVLFAATLRYTVTSTLGTSGLTSLFDGSYETNKEVPISSSDVINIDFGGAYPGYSYGYIEVSFYYINIPDSVTCRVYTNYAPHGGPGWIDITMAPISTTGTSAVWRGNCGIYQITDMEITVNSGSSISSKISGIKFLLSRKQSNNEKPYFTKYQQNNSYYDLDFIGATVSIDGNDVIHTGGGQTISGTTTLANLDVTGTTALTGLSTIDPNNTSTTTPTLKITNSSSGDAFIQIAIGSSIFNIGGDNTDDSLKITSGNDLDGTTVIKIDSSGYIYPNLPTSIVGIPSGAMWNDSGVVKIV